MQVYLDDDQVSLISRRFSPMKRDCNLNSDWSISEGAPIGAFDISYAN